LAQAESVRKGVVLTPELRQRSHGIRGCLEGHLPVGGASLPPCKRPAQL